MMRKTGAFFLILILVAGNFSGCAVSRNDFVRLNPNAATYPPKPASDPIYLTTMGMDDPYEEIGYIHISEMARQAKGYDMLNEKLRTKAREVGADAVIYITYGTENAFSIIPFFISIPYDVVTVQGLAVRKKK